MEKEDKGKGEGDSVFSEKGTVSFRGAFQNRLVFDEHLNCFHLTWRSVHRLSISRPKMGAMGVLVRKAVRAFLFFPRFFYLIIGVTLLKLRRLANRCDC